MTNKPQDYTEVPLKRTPMKCKRCNWEWSTISDAWHLSCPSCGIKVKRRIEENE